MISAVIPNSKVRRGLFIAIFFGLFFYINYKVFIEPSQPGYKGTGFHFPGAAPTGRMQAIGKAPPVLDVFVDPKDPSHGNVPMFEFDPRAALSDNVLLEDIFWPGYNLTKKMMKHAWDGYKKFAWGHDELKPLEKNGITALGSVSTALTMVDALDTLMLMNMQEEFLEARDYLFDHVTYDHVN